MERAVFDLPGMWADHHVLAVRDALGAVSGVSQIVASSLYRDVQVEYDPAQVSRDVLLRRLAEAGYAVGAEPSLPGFAKRIDDSSDWFRFQDRLTVTDRRDLEMSGDFRKY